MVKIKVCIGSSCHLKGSRAIVERLRDLIEQQNLQEEVELSGVFCMGKCRNGVCVSIGDTLFSLSPETTDSFFSQEVLPRVRAE